MKKVNKRTLKKLFCIPAVLTMVLVTACGSSGGSYKGDAADMAGGVNFAASPAMVTEEAIYDYAYDDVYDEEEYEMSSEAKPETGGEQAEQVKDSGRKLIKNYSLEAETKEFANLIGKIEARVGALGGYVESCDTGIANYNLNTRYARYVIRIPKANADSFVETVENASNVTNKSENVEDVTLQYVDLESHRNALKTEQTRLLELLNRAESVEDIITVEQRLSDVRYQLESMESQLRTYDNKIEYSTIRLNISEVEEITKPEEKTIGGRIKEGLAENFLRLVDSLVDFLVWLITGIPFWILLAVIVLLVILIVKVCRKAALKKRQKAWEKQQSQMQQYQMNGQPVSQPIPQGVNNNGQPTTEQAIQQKPADDQDTPPSDKE